MTLANILILLTTVLGLYQTPDLAKNPVLKAQVDTMAVQVIALATQALAQPASTPLGSLPSNPITVSTPSSTDQPIVVNLQPVFGTDPVGPVKSLSIEINDSCKFDTRDELPYHGGLSVFYQEDGRRVSRVPDYAITLSVNSDQGVIGTNRQIGPATRASSTMTADIPLDGTSGCDANSHRCGQFFYQTAVPGTYTFTATGAGASASLDMTCK